MTLILDEPGPTGHDKTIAARDLRIRSGINTTSITVPPLHDLEIVVPGATSRTRVGLSAPTTTEGQRRRVSETGCDSDGRALFAELPAGDYWLLVSGPKGESGSMRVVVPCGRIEFRPDRP